MASTPSTDRSAPANPFAPLLAAPPDRPFVVAQLGQSLDGKIATETGESQWINHNCALDHVHGLRAHVDAVVVGAGTVSADDPRLNVRRVPGRSPARVIIDPSGRLRPDAKCLAEDGVPIFLVVCEKRPLPAGMRGDIVQVPVPRSNGQMPPLAIVEGLYAHGLRRLLIEGGAMTVSAFVAARAVDRLHLLVAPVILGSGKPGLVLPTIAHLCDALRPRTEVHVLPDGDVLFDCDLRATRQRG